MDTYSYRHALALVPQEMAKCHIIIDMLLYASRFNISNQQHTLSGHAWEKMVSPPRGQENQASLSWVKKPTGSSSYKTIPWCHRSLHKRVIRLENPPPCLWHQVRVLRVLSAAAGSGAAGLRGNLPSRLNSGADSAWPCAHLHALFFQLIFASFSVSFLVAPWEVSGLILAGFWFHFWIKITTHFWIDFLNVFPLIFQWCCVHFQLQNPSKTH